MLIKKDGERMILGLDLSSVNSGYSIFDGSNLVSYGSIIPDKKMNHSEKLAFIYDEINKLFKQFNITAVSIEDQHLRQNVDTLKLLSRIGGVAMLCAEQHGASVYLYPAPTIKLTFTGNGKAEKNDMILKAMELYKMQRCMLDDNMADAIGCAYTHMQLGGMVPKKNKVKKNRGIQSK
jgi:crossover junction endodeoxyribonuclease RuvC